MKDKVLLYGILVRPVPLQNPHPNSVLRIHSHPRDGATCMWVDKGGLLALAANYKIPIGTLQNSKLLDFSS